MGDVAAAWKWNTNAALIADVAKLGYLDGAVLDLSHNAGKFWTTFEPAHLTTNDLDPQWSTMYMHDVTLGPVPEWREGFDSVVWDGPYRLNGTPDQGDFDRRYGTSDTARWQDRMLDLKLGAVTAIQCARPGGFVLIKCQDQVVSGSVKWQTEELAAVGRLFHAPLVDRFVMVRPVRSQGNRRQIHARNNVSTLLVLQKAKR